MREMAVSTNIQPLKNLYQTLVDSLTDTLDRAKAQLALDVWEQAEISYQEILEATATQYSTTGRTVTKRNLDQAERARNAARAELEGILGAGDGGVTYADNGGRIG